MVFEKQRTGGKVDLLLQCVPQPWHAQSAYMHEVALAVKSIDGSKFFPACEALFAAQESFFDAATADKSRNQIYSELAAVVAAATGLDAAVVLDQLTCQGEGNCGNKTTLQMKWAIKYHRVRSGAPAVLQPQPLLSSSCLSWCDACLRCCPTPQCM